MFTHRNTPTPTHAQVFYRIIPSFRGLLFVSFLAFKAFKAPESFDFSSFALLMSVS